MKKLAIFLTAFAMVSTIAAYAADAAKKQTTTTTESNTAAGIKQDMAMFKQEMAVKLEAAEAHIAALKEKAKVKGSSVKQSTVADLESTKLKIKNDLAALDKSTETTWTTMKSKIATAMDDLNTKTQKLLRE